MHVVLPSSDLDLSLPSRRVFFAVLWLLAAGRGFLAARDSLVPAGTGRPALQASR